MAHKIQQARKRGGNGAAGARYVRRDMWRDPLTTRDLPTYFCLDTQTGDVVECNNAVHACALTSNKNRQFYSGEACNWIRYVACYKTKDAFRMLEFFEKNVV